MHPEVTTHALLRVAHSPTCGVDGDGAELPPWAQAALARAPWVVVRRARSSGGLIPVGVRGAERSERLAAWLDPRAVLECLTPAGLAARAAWRGSARSASIPALAALDSVAALMGDRGLEWGPCGSVGFELASGLPAASARSDLDLMVAVRAPVSRALASALQAALADLGVRTDVLLEGAGGAVALGDYARAGGSLVLRTRDGPRRVDDPWSVAAVAA